MSPAATIRGCATAVSLMVSSSEVVPWADQVDPGDLAEGGQLACHRGQFQPGGKETGGL